MCLVLLSAYYVFSVILVLEEQQRMW
jgi:hypothetical protein